MLGALFVLTALSAAPVKSLAAPGFQCAAIDVKLVESFMTHFAQQLAARGFEVTTPQEVAALVGLERQKQMLACSDTGCSAELAAALGVDALITGSMAKVGSGYLVDIKIIRARDGGALAIYSGRPKTDDQVLDFLEASAKDFAERYASGSATVPSTVSAQSHGEAQVAKSGAGTLPWVAAGVAAATLIAGGVFLGLAQSTAADLRAGKADGYPGLQSLQSTGRTQETVGWSLLGAGAAVAVVSAVLFLIGGSSAPATVSLAPAPGGGGLFVRGSF